MKTFRYFLETLVVRSAFAWFNLFSLQHASDMGGWLLRKAGPMTRRHDIARANIIRAMPELGKDEVVTILQGMWDNIGRTLAEFSQLGKMDKDSFRDITLIEGVEHLKELEKTGKSGLFFSGHFANWETAPKTMAVCGWPLALVYRKGNNPGLDGLIQEVRSHYQSAGVPKSASGSRRLISLLHERRHIGMLVDQKMNDGIEVPFFGSGVMTAPAIAGMALKYDCPIIPVKTVRINGPQHKVTILPPIKLVRTGNRQQDIHTLMSAINALLEQWVRENPAQWIWLHNRWPKTD